MIGDVLRDCLHGRVGPGGAVGVYGGRVRFGREVCRTCRFEYDRDRIAGIDHARGPAGAVYQAARREKGMWPPTSATAAPFMVVEPAAYVVPAGTASASHDPEVLVKPVLATVMVHVIVAVPPAVSRSRPWLASSLSISVAVVLLELVVAWRAVLRGRRKVIICPA